jgi:hypothetical protein
VVVAHTCGEHQTTHYFVLPEVVVVVLTVEQAEMVLQQFKALQQQQAHLELSLVALAVLAEQEAQEVLALEAVAVVGAVTGLGAMEAMVDLAL